MKRVKTAFAFASAVLIMLFGITNMVISVFVLSFYIGIAGIYSVILGVTKFWVLINYRAIQNFSNKKAIKEVEWIVAKRTAITTAALSFLHFSFAIVVTFFHDEPIKDYELIFIIYFGTSAIISIIVTTIDAIRTRKNSSIVLHHLKLIAWANAFIILSVTQRTLLFYAGYPYAKVISGIGGVFFSICSAVVCLYMFRKSRQCKRYLLISP